MLLLRNQMDGVVYELLLFNQIKELNLMIQMEKVMYYLSKEIEIT